MQDLQNVLQALKPRLRAWRRDFHAYPEIAWHEYRSASKIIEEFQSLGYSPIMGKAAVHHDKAACSTKKADMSKDAQEKARAIAQGANPELVQKMDDGHTGFWVDMQFPHASTGINTTESTNILAFRFDMDANAILECCDLEHQPTSLGFASQNINTMHACGHDGHMAIGLGLAHVLHHMAKDLHGTVRLIFQPAEEVGQGAKAMLDAGVMRNVQELIGLHIGVQAHSTGQLICGTTHFLANTTFEIAYEGQTAHAGYAPHQGKNALLAACMAVQAIHAIARHGEGSTRVNVGQLFVDGAPNVIPSKAWFAGETRGITSQINAWLMEEVERISQNAAAMWQCTNSIERKGLCPSGYSDESLAKDVYDVAKSMPCFESISLSEKFMASEDFTWLLKAVQDQGGKGTYIQLGAERSAGHHNDRFDFDERSLLQGVELLARLVSKKLCKS